MLIPYLKARLVKGKNRWYIVYYQVNPKSNKLERHRETHDLNRIKDLNERAVHAQKLLDFIDEELQNGYPYNKKALIQLNYTSLLDAMDIALNVKNGSDRFNTKRSYGSFVKIFKEYVEWKLDKYMDVRDFDKGHAIQFLDYALLKRKVSNTTYNNYITNMRSIFGELVKRDYMSDNPFSGITPRKNEGKNRRAFSSKEVKDFIPYIFENHKQLMSVVLLQFHCFIRPSELRRLKFYMFDLNRGLITLPSSVTKNKETGHITIPDVLIPYLKERNFHKIHRDWYVFGKKLVPGTEQCGRHSMYNLHKKYLQRALSLGLLSDINGLSLYSWKDTGAIDLVNQGFNIVEIMKQLRHKDLSQTQKYLESLERVNNNIKRSRTRIIPK